MFPKKLFVFYKGQKMKIFAVSIENKEAKEKIIWLLNHLQEKRTKIIS